MVAIAGCGHEPPTKAAPPLIVHLSFDDAPLQVGPPGVALEVNERILATLAARQLPASVFFNCAKLQRDDGLVERWASSGAVVGNHTSHHLSLNKVAVDAWLADVADCDGVLGERLGSEPVYFRYPHLAEGKVAEEKAAAAAGLSAMGYKNAPVSVATTEWLLAAAYARALQTGDAAAAAEVVAAYRTHMIDALKVARDMAVAAEGHDVAHIVLFHVNQLAADHLGEVLADYDALGVRYVGLEEALADPIYAKPDVYVGRGGLSWLYRTETPPDLPYWFGLEEGRLEERFAVKPPGSP